MTRATDRVVKHQIKLRKAGIKMNQRTEMLILKQKINEIYLFDFIISLVKHKNFLLYTKRQYKVNRMYK